MKTRDLSPWRTVVIILFVIFIVILAISIYYQEYKPILIILLCVNILMFLKYFLDYFDYSRISIKNKIYRERKTSDIIINIHNTKYYLGTYALRVDADGVRIADISKGRNAEVPIPKKTQCLTLSMRGTPNTIEITDFSPDDRINTWVRYGNDRSRELKMTVTTGEQRFNEKPLFENYAKVLRLRQDNAIWGIFISAIPMIVLIVFIVAPIF